MKAITLITLLAVSVLSGCAASGNDASIFTKYATSPIVIDGGIDEPCWKNANSGSFDEERTYGYVRALWDKHYLYLAVTCYHEKQISQDRLLISFTKPHRQLLSMIIRPDGKCLDPKVSNMQMVKFSPDVVQCAVGPRQKGRWTAEIRISLAAIEAIGNDVNFSLKRTGAYKSSRKDRPPRGFCAEVSSRLHFDYNSYRKERRKLNR